jgi:hypothetical protein
MRSTSVFAGWLCAALALWVSAGALTVTTSHAADPRIAFLPPVWILGALIAAAVIVAAATHRHRAAARAARPLFASLALLLPWLPTPIPAAFLLWTGPLRWWAWIAIALAVLAAIPRARWRWTKIFADPRRAPALAALLTLGLGFAAARQVASRLPTGDEPAYLAIAQSLLHDHTLAIEGVYRRGDYHAYYHGNLAPDYLRRGTDGRIYSVHAPGLPVLILPAFAALGYRGVTRFLVLVAAAGSMLVWQTAFTLTADAAAAWFGWAAVALSVPFFLHTFMVFPDAPAAVLVMYAVRPLAEPFNDSRSGRWLIRGAAVGLLPWLHVRYAVIAAAIGLLLALKLLRRTQRRQLVALAIVPALSAVGWVALSYIIYGTPNPTAAYGGGSQMALANLAPGLTGLLVDQQFGLIPNAPVYLVAAAGFVLLWKARRRLALELLTIVVPYTLVVAAYQMWWGGDAAPARFLVPILLLGAWPAAWLFSRARREATRGLALAALTISVLLTASMVLVNHGGLIFNNRNASALWLRWLAPAIDLPRSMPSVFLNRSSILWLQVGLWAIGLAALVGAAYGAERRRAMGVALPATAVLALTMVVPLGWWVSRAVPITANASQVAWLRSYRPDLHGVGIGYAPPRRIAYGALPSRLRIGPTFASLPADGPPLVAIFAPPAGTYELDTSAWGRGSGQVTIAVDSSLPPIVRIPVGSGDGQAVHRFELPATVNGLVVDADAGARRILHRVWLRPLWLAGSADTVGQRRAVHAARYGPALVFSLDRGSYLEGGGLWVRPRYATELAIAPPPDRPLALELHNAPVANTIALRSGEWSETVTLGPRESRTIELPEAPDERVLALTIEATAGYRPVDVDPGSRDDRWLACWVEFR